MTQRGPAITGRGGGRRASALEHRQDLLDVEAQRAFGQLLRRAVKTEARAQLELADRGAALVEFAQGAVRRAPDGGFEDASTMPLRPVSFAISPFLA